MSRLHNLYFTIIKQFKQDYDPQKIPNYPLWRRLKNGLFSTLSVFSCPRQGVRVEHRKVAGLPAEYLSSPGNRSDTIIFYIHGGSYVAGSAAARHWLTGTLAARLHDVCAVNYRLAPEHPYPAAIDDCFTAYRAVARDYRNVILLGESAGATLVLLVAQRARDEGLRQPAAIVSLSPIGQMREELPSYAANEATDCMLRRDSFAEIRDSYLQGQDITQLPYAEPLHAGLHGLAPTFISATETEVLLDDALLLTREMKEAGVDVTLDLVPDLMHAYAMFTPIPESQDLLRRIGIWLQDKLL